MTATPEELLSDLLARAKAAGADGADALFFNSVALSHAQRLGKVERLEREESKDLGLRVFLGQRQASVSSTDFSSAVLDELVRRALAMVRAVPEDPYCGLAGADQLAVERPELDLFDAAEPSPEDLIERAKACEDAARAVTGVTNSEGAEAGWSLSAVTLATSNGFLGSYKRSGHSVGVAVLAGEGQAMERDYDYSSTVHGADLADPAAVGQKAGERAVARLNARKPATASLPVVFDPRVASSLLGHFSGAVSGPAIARGTSFLKDKMDQMVFAPGVSIVDDPHRRRGLRSKPFDGEGVPNGPPVYRRSRPAQDLVPRSRLGPPTGPQHHRPRRAGHRRPAQSFHHQPLYGGRRGQPQRDDRRHRRRPLCHRDDGHGRQPGDRRLFPRRRRLLDRKG